MKSEPFDALVCDMCMPEMTGLDLLERLQYDVNTKNVPVIVLTGEADHRTPISETEQYYQALKLRKIETAMVRIPGASHGIANRPSQLIAKVVRVRLQVDRKRKANMEPESLRIKIARILLSQLGGPLLSVIPTAKFEAQCSECAQRVVVCGVLGPETLGGLDRVADPSCAEIEAQDE